MISEERMKKILNDESLSDQEVKQIRDGLYNLAEIIFEKWQGERKNKKLLKNSINQ